MREVKKSSYLSSAKNLAQIQLFKAKSFDQHHVSLKLRTSHLEVFCRKGALRNFAKFTGKHLHRSLFFNRPKACNFIKKETLAHLFSCEFCEICKNTFFNRTPPVAAFENCILVFCKYNFLQEKYKYLHVFFTFQSIINMYS